MSKTFRMKILKEHTKRLVTHRFLLGLICAGLLLWLFDTCNGCREAAAGFSNPPIPPESVVASVTPDVLLGRAVDKSTNAVCYFLVSATAYSLPRELSCFQLHFQEVEKTR